MTSPDLSDLMVLTSTLITTRCSVGSPGVGAPRLQFRAAIQSAFTFALS